MKGKYKITRRMIQILSVILLITPGLGFSFFNGSLIASNLLGINLIDPLAFVELLVAGFSITLTSLFALLIVILFYYLIGGRTFCSFICPVHLLSEITGYLNKKVAIFKLSSSIKWKYYLLAIVVVVSFITSIPFFTTYSPIGAMSRELSEMFSKQTPESTMTFVSFNGISWTILLIFSIFIFELLISSNIWCRALCPVGASYSLIGKYSPTKIKIDHDKCVQCDECFEVCMVKEVLDDPVYREKNNVIKGDCSRCLNCIDACPENALSLSFNFIREK